MKPTLPCFLIALAIAAVLVVKLTGSLAALLGIVAVILGAMGLIVVAVLLTARPTSPDDPYYDA
jgi:hypothetical protein